MGETLKKVDKIEVVFLVDNTIEWMTKLPPGFQHELRQHLAQSPRVDPLTGVPFVDLEHYCCGAHGFSALIKTTVVENDSATTYHTLFDTGPDSNTIIRNMRALKIPYQDISTVVLSHWHADHTGGLLSFLSLRNVKDGDGSSSLVDQCTVDVHPDRPVARGIAPPPTFDKIIGRLPVDPTYEEIEASGAYLQKWQDPHTIAGNTIYVSGEIPRITRFETGLLGGVRWTQRQDTWGWANENAIMDERYLAVDVYGKGLVIFSACSHAGIVNVVKDAIKVFSRPVHMVQSFCERALGFGPDVRFGQIIGGLHLAPPETASRIPLTVDFLASALRPSPTYILPMHCSGFQAKIALEAAFGDGCVPAGVGHKFEIDGDRANDERLSISVSS